MTWHLENPYIPPKWGANQDHQGFRYRYSEAGYPQEHRNVLREIAEGTGSPCGSGRVDGVLGKSFPNPRAWYEWIVKDMTAYWRTVRDDEGCPIPLVIRPFHEMDGDWFWWGSGSTTPQDYIAVYRLMTSPGVDFAIAATYDGPWTFPESEAGKDDMRRFFKRPEVLSGDAHELFK